MRFLPILLLAACGLGGNQSVMADGAVVLMYHRFGDGRFPATNIRVDQFRAHLDYLRDNDYSVIPLARMLTVLGGGDPLPPKAVVITIDDAFRSVFETGHPILREYNVPYTLFVSTDALDQGLSDYMTWDELAELSEAGVSIANHGAAHESLLTVGDVAADVMRAKARLVEHVESLDGVFAYPYGEFDIDAMQVLRDLGFRYAFGQHSGAVGEASPRYSLPRFPMNETFGAPDQFATKISSKAMPVASVVPQEPLTDNRLPRITVELSEAISSAAITCFVGGQGQVEIDWLAPGRRFSVGPKRPFGAGRQRVNCTAPVGDGSFYWFGHPWFVIPTQ